MTNALAIRKMSIIKRHWHNIVMLPVPREAPRGYRKMKMTLIRMRMIVMTTMTVALRQTHFLIRGTKMIRQRMMMISSIARQTI